MKIDCIITWPDHWRYPLFNKQLALMRGFFEDVYIVFTPTNLGDISNEIEKELGSAFTYIHTKVIGDHDWRDTAVRDALGRINFNERTHVLFIEQDFLISDPFDFFSRILSLGNETPLIAYNDNGRWHPAFMLVPTRYIEWTSRDFSARPEKGYDHFGQFTKELEAQNLPMLSLEAFGLLEPVSYYHMAGLTNNLYRHEVGMDILHKPQEFADYLQACELIEIADTI